jgi:hypothetical protein
MALDQRLLGDQFGGRWEIEWGKSVWNGGGAHDVLDELAETGGLNRIWVCAREPRGLVAN